MRRSFHFTSLLAGALALVLAGGCELFNSDKDNDRDRDDRDRGQETVGRSVDVPRSARVEAEGKGVLEFRARDDGTVYLYDAEDHRVVDTQRVRDGDRYTVDLDKDNAQLNGRTVFDRNLERTHEHRIYFDRERR